MKTEKPKKITRDQRDYAMKQVWDAQRNHNRVVRDHFKAKRKKLDSREKFSLIKQDKVPFTMTMKDICDNYHPDLFDAYDFSAYEVEVDETAIEKAQNRVEKEAKRIRNSLMLDTWTPERVAKELTAFEAKDFLK
jgi:hypothetical protein